MVGLWTSGGGARRRVGAMMLIACVSLAPAFSQLSGASESASAADVDAPSQDPPTATDEPVTQDPAAPAAEKSKTPAKAEADDGDSKLVRLHPEQEVWVDAARKRVIVGGEICLRRGQLEMFACPRATKEHESVVAVNAQAYLVHTALLSVGARVGHPVRYDPVYVSAAGDRIKVEVIWRGEDGQPVRQLAQHMIRNVKSQDVMKHGWVFAGSGFWKDEDTGQEYYQAEGGELICVSNFSTATLDLPVESPRDNADLLYEAWTDRIPPLKTKVRLVLSVERPAGPNLQ